MARGTSLSQLRDQLRAEIGASANPAMGTNAVHSMNLMLSRTQERLWNDFDWPFMVVDRDVPMQTGQRYYAFPSDLDFNRVFQTDVKYSATWRTVGYDIGVEQFNFMDSDEGERQDPVLRWQHTGDVQFEVWPIPASNDTIIRFKGVRNLKPLVMDTDVCDLDDKLIVLFAAAEMLAHNKAADADTKAALATSYYARLRGNSMKSGMFTYGGGSGDSKGFRGMMGGKMPNPQG
jgi:hypothetical protein